VLDQQRGLQGLHEIAHQTTRLRLVVALGGAEPPRQAVEEAPHARLAVDGEPRVRPFLDRLSQRLAAPDRRDEAQARALVRDLVLALQAVLLIRHAPPEVADAFCASRLEQGAGAVFGLLPRSADTRAIVARAAALQ
jgi:putative acyl-CoA dehydrogenase